LALDRLFLDANVLFSAAYRPNAGLARFWKLPKVTLCSSRYAVEEARINLATAAQRERLQSFAAKLELVDAIESASSLPDKISLPEKDRPILLAAVAARATYLITGDFRHFGPFFGTSVRGVLILSPADYLELSSRR
jgi:predicted nucleic acid-binding protein